MAYNPIPTRSIEDTIASTDINQLSENCEYLKNEIIATNENVTLLLNNYERFIVLANNVENNESVANTLKDTGLAFNIAAGETWYFEFVGVYDSAATTTGSRWVVAGNQTPAMIGYTSEYSLTATTQTINYCNAFNIPASCNATSAYTTGNTVWIGGIIKAGANNDTIKVRFASEVASSAITLKAGSYIKVKKLG